MTNEILVIDDNSDIRKLISGILEDKGFKIREAANFDQAISANHYYNFNKYPEGNMPLSVIATDLLYSYKMGLKTLYYANTDDGKTDTGAESGNDDCAGGACTL